MKKIILASFIVCGMAGAAFASSAPSGNDTPPPPAPVPQNLTIGNNAGDTQAPLTLTETDKNGTVRTLTPGSSGGFDPSLCPCTIEFK